MSEHPCTIRNDVASFDLDMICGFIQQSYWGQGRARERILKSFEGSICFGAFSGDRQVGFARVVSDQVFHAYIFGLFVMAAFRGRGIAKALMKAILGHDQLCDVTGFMLTTRTTHGVYEPFGFVTPSDPTRYMVRRRPEPK